MTWTVERVDRLRAARAEARLSDDFRAFDLLRKGVLNLSVSEHVWLARHFNHKGNYAARDTAMHNARVLREGSV